MEQFFGAEPVALLVKCSITTVWRKCRDGEWPHRKLGRFYRFSADDIREIQELMRPKPVARTNRRKRQAI